MSHKTLDDDVLAGCVALGKQLAGTGAVKKFKRVWIS
jgi:hypothetical protein